MTSRPPALSNEFARAIASWTEQDPDPETRQQVQDLLTAADAGESEAIAELVDAFSGRLQFGTAGLRGALGPGPNRMNRVVVGQAAAALATYLLDHGLAGGKVIIGFDARRNSDVFAKDTAEIMAGAGFEAMITSGPLPTPVVAFGIGHFRLRRRRGGHRVAQSASRQRLQGLPGRRLPDRATSRRRDLLADR